jgi:glyoxylase-like metal-dependent hydrolase (beta-lactamase superfamily II)
MSTTLDIHQVGGKGYDSNIYFLETSKPILIDAGTGFNVKETFEILSNFKSAEKLERLILTHNHVDHTGGAGEVAEEYNLPIFAHKLDGAALQEGDAQTTGATMFGRDQPKLTIQYLEDGGTIDCGDITLQIFHTPGHSPGSISLYEETTKSLFCGDLVFMDGGVGRWDLPGGDYKTLVSSVEKVTGLDIDNFYPGHGPGCEGDAMKFIKLSYKYLKSCEGFA